MLPRIPSALLLLTACAACTRKEPARDVAASTAVEATREQPTARVPAGPTAGAPLALALRVEKKNIGVGLHVVNGGTASVKLAADVSVRRVDESQGTPTKALTLRASCRTTGCVELAPGGELLAPSHLLLVEGERCDPLFKPARSGQYELTVRSCDGTQQARTRFVWEAP